MVDRSSTLQPDCYRRSSKSSKNPQEHTARAYYEYRWCCCNCGDAGMSVVIDQCPECQQIRCHNCLYEEVEANGYVSYGRGPSSSYSLFETNNSPWRVPWISNALPNQDPDENPSCFQAAPSKDSLENLPSVIDIASEVPSDQPQSSVSSPNSSQKSSGSSPVFSDIPDTVESETEIESDATHSDDDDPESDTIFGFSAHTIHVLEGCLLSTLTADLDFAAQLIPRIYGILQRGTNPTSAASATSAPNDTGDTPDEASSSSSSSGVEHSNSASSDNSQARKRGVGENGEGGENDAENEGNKRRKKDDSTGNPPGARSGTADTDLITFACHFCKRNPSKYNRQRNKKYHNCVSPSIPYHRLRAIKDHFKVHRIPQCDRCYEIFETIEELKAHRQGVESCVIGRAELKEGIDEVQWQQIETVLRAKTDKGKSPIDKWYDIWDILFPGVPRPSNPWSEVATQSTSESLSAEDIASRFEENLERRISQGLIRRDETYHHWMEAFHQAIGMQPFFEPHARLEHHSSSTSVPRNHINRESTHIALQSFPEHPRRSQGSAAEDSDLTFLGSNLQPTEWNETTQELQPIPSSGYPTQPSVPIVNHSANISYTSTQEPSSSSEPSRPSNQDSAQATELGNSQFDTNFTDMFDMREDYDWSLNDEHHFENNNYWPPSMFEEEAQATSGTFGNDDSDYLINMLEGELKLPTAGLEFKDRNDLNNGLERPCRPDWD